MDCPTLEGLPTDVIGLIVEFAGHIAAIRLTECSTGIKFRFLFSCDLPTLSFKTSRGSTVCMEATL